MRLEGWLHTQQERKQAREWSEAECRAKKVSPTERRGSVAARGAPLRVLTFRQAVQHASSEGEYLTKGERCESVTRSRSRVKLRHPGKVRAEILRARSEECVTGASTKYS